MGGRGEKERERESERERERAINTTHTHTHFRLVYEIGADQRQQLEHNVIELADRLNDPPLGA